VSRIPLSRPVSTPLPAQPISMKPAHTIFLLGSLPSLSRCLADPTHQPLSFTGRNRYAPDPLPHSLPSQTRPLPLLLVALPVGDILAMPCAKVLHPSLCELPIASLRLPPRLWTAGKPHCRRGIASSCYINRSLSSPLNRRDVGAKHSMTTPHAMPLLPPSLLAPHAAPSSLQLPGPVLHRHHALARSCTPRGHHQPPPVHLTSSSTVYGQTPSASPPRKAAATATSLLCLAAHACTAAEPSPPSLPPCTGLHCPHAIRSYKRRPSHSFVRAPTAASHW
jgi:hypothetical protein